MASSQRSSKRRAPARADAGRSPQRARLPRAAKSRSRTRKFLSYYRPHIPLLLADLACALIVSATEGVTAWLVKPAMDDIFIRRDAFMLRIIPVALLAIYVVRGTARYAQSYIMAAVGERIVARLRRDLYVHIQGMPLAFFSGVHSADLISRIMNDINRLSHISSNVLVMAVLFRRPHGFAPKIHA